MPAPIEIITAANTITIPILANIGFFTNLVYSSSAKQKKFSEFSKTLLKRVGVLNYMLG
jgi:hypothetical protein